VTSQKEQEQRAGSLSQAMRAADLPRRIALAVDAVGGRVVFTTSFGLEDQAITHAIVASGSPVEIATLDTGRLFPETYELWSQTEERYGRPVRAVVPDREALEALVESHGINGFRGSIEARMACCGVRKVEPLDRALRGAAGWISGLRAEQSRNRAETGLAAFDAERNLFRINPLADWSRDTLAAYVADNSIPYNPLHDRGFLSIGCAPCTRAVRVGEPERAGRWWWEAESKKECGLHLRGAPTTAAMPA
jgi:phosphoadenosine phosphosulfate reductase